MSRDNGDAISKNQEAVLSGRKGWRVRVEYFSALPAASGVSSIPGLGKSPGEGKGYPLQYSGLENSMGCIVHGVAKHQTRLSDSHFHFTYCIK